MTTLPSQCISTHIVDMTVLRFEKIKQSQMTTMTWSSTFKPSCFTCALMRCFGNALVDWKISREKIKKHPTKMTVAVATYLCADGHLTQAKGSIFRLVKMTICLKCQKLGMKKCTQTHSKVPRRHDQ